MFYWVESWLYEFQTILFFKFKFSDAKITGLLFAYTQPVPKSPSSIFEWVKLSFICWKKSFISWYIAGLPCLDLPAGHIWQGYSAWIKIVEIPRTRTQYFFKFWGKCGHNFFIYSVVMWLISNNRWFRKYLNAYIGEGLRVVSLSAHLKWSRENHSKNLHYVN